MAKEIKKSYSIYDWLKMETENVLDIFASLPNAQRIGKDDEQFVYIPGTRKDKVLLVAHSDTVWDGDKRSVRMHKGRYESLIKGTGIGADDRAGCSMLWQLRESGHSLLIPNAEESGCVGSGFLMRDSDWANEINDNHCFAIEMDRMNASDLVFYEVGSMEFVKWCEENFTGYKRAGGSYTDICRLCRTITGVNISVGYYHQHSGDEILVEAQYYRTLNILKKVLAQENIPRFERPKYTPPPIHQNSRLLPNYYNGRNEGPSRFSDYESYDEYYEQRHGAQTASIVRERTNREKAEETRNKISSDTRYSSRHDTFLVCTNSDCDAVMEQIEYDQNNNRCIFCGETGLY